MVEEEKPSSGGAAAAERRATVTAPLAGVAALTPTVGATLVRFAVEDALRFGAAAPEDTVLDVESELLPRDRLVFAGEAKLLSTVDTLDTISRGRCVIVSRAAESELPAPPPPLLPAAVDASFDPAEAAEAAAIIDALSEVDPPRVFLTST